MNNWKNAATLAKPRPLGRGKARENFPGPKGPGLAAVVCAFAEQLESRLLMARPLGIDVSHWDGTINWTSVRAAGKEFAFQKATEGTTYTDPTFTTNMNGGKNAGVLMGAYHFGHPANNNAA